MNYVNEVFEAVSGVDVITEEVNESYLEYIATKLNTLYSDSGISVVLEGDSIFLNFQGVDLFDLEQCLIWLFKYRDEAEERIEDIGDYSGDFEVRGCESGLEAIAKRL